MDQEYLAVLEDPARLEHLVIPAVRHVLGGPVGQDYLELLEDRAGSYPRQRARVGPWQDLLTPLLSAQQASLPQSQQGILPREMPSRLSE